MPISAPVERPELGVPAAVEEAEGMDDEDAAAAAVASDSDTVRTVVDDMTGALVNGAWEVEATLVVGVCC